MKLGPIHKWATYATGSKMVVRCCCPGCAQVPVSVRGCQTLSRNDAGLLRVENTTACLRGPVWWSLDDLVAGEAFIRSVCGSHNMIPGQDFLRDADAFVSFYVSRGSMGHSEGLTVAPGTYGDERGFLVAMSIRSWLLHEAPESTLGLLADLEAVL